MDKHMLIGPKEFKELYAPQLGVETIREIFKKDDFPSVLIGKRRLTTRAAAETWLESVGEKTC